MKRGKLACCFVSKKDTSQNIENQDSQGNQQGAAPSQSNPVFIGAHCKLENDNRQVSHGLAHVIVEELVVQGGEQQGGSLATDSRNGQ